MQITFLVGNGFDISCGIDTSYKSFYHWYLKQASKTDVIKKFKEDIQNDLIGKGERWADFEAGLGKFSSNFTKETAADFIEIYENAHDSIITYIDTERKKFGNFIDNPVTEDSLRSGILHFYQELTPDEQDIINQLRTNDHANNTEFKFISFNYTDALDICVKELAKSPLSTWTYNGLRKTSVAPSVLHIHGTVDHYPILGVGEEYQFANKDLLSHPGISEIMIKSKSVQVVGERWYRDAKKQINNSQIVCIWGMSLGDTDSIWWGYLTEWLKAGSSRQLVIYWYTKEPPNGVSVFKFVNEKTKIINRLMQFSSCTIEEINQLSNRIHIVFNTEKVLRVSLSKKEPITD